MNEEYNSNITTYWTEELTVNKSLIKIIFSKDELNIIYSKANKLSVLFYKILKSVFLSSSKNTHLIKNNYNLAELFEKKVNLGVKNSYALPNTSEEIYEYFREKKLFSNIPEHINNSLQLYLKRKISQDISEIVRICLIVKWLERHGDDGEHKILLPRLPYVDILINCLGISRQTVVYNVKGSLINPIISKLKYVAKFIQLCVPYSVNTGSGRAVAVELVDGIDTQRRSDIFWASEPPLNNENIFIYCSLPLFKKIIPYYKKVKIVICYSLKNFIEIKKLINVGELIKCQVNIGCNSVDKTLTDYFFSLYDNYQTDIIRWIYFIKSNDIKVHFSTNSPSLASICRNKALDLCNCISVGSQRSCFTLNKYQPFIYYNTNDVFFVWGTEIQRTDNRNNISLNYVVSGYPYNIDTRNKSTKTTLQKDRFRIAIFDNAIHNYSFYSQPMLESFYSVFLDWLLIDEDVELLIKSKKPHKWIIGKLVKISEKFSHASATGRCTVIDDDFNRLPLEVAQNADIAVGIGVSSAVMEAVISGKPGIHCDLSGFNSSQYYTWGYGKLIFNDLGEMISALKRFKEGSFPELGDWTGYIDNIDPFRDGQCGRRIGMYISWLLEHLGEHDDKYEAIEYANKNYIEQWGESNIFRHG